MDRTSGQDQRFLVTYRLTVRDGRPVEDHARDITIEQTAEVPEDVIPQGHFDHGITGRVESILPVPGTPGRFDVCISFRCDITGFSVPQFFNVLYGNISLKDNILVTGVDLPASLRSAFGGPTFGVEGLRRLTGVYGRPLACTAIKPMGLSVDALARIAGAFAAGGIDLIKDDHGLTDQHFHPFAERVARCQETVAAANARTGRVAFYFPMVSGGFDAIEEQVRVAVRQGVRGILMAPMLVGPDTMRCLARKYNLVVMAHPALTGTFFHDRSHGMTPAVLLGTLFRLIGADVSIFPNAGGRFHFTEAECLALATALRAPLGAIPAAFPCPAGGMSLARIAEMGAMYGPDTVILIGGDVLRQRDIQGGTRRFMEAIRSRFSQELRPPVEAPVSSCEWRPGEETTEALRDLLTFRGYRWDGRSPIAYKPEGDADFLGISRQELAGKFGEHTRFDLRYFEIEPGGYSTLEKHVHEHVIIGARGSGVLVKGERRQALRTHDIAYIRPLEAHQLRNEGSEPFGFYCIVDHERDRPQAL